MTFSGVATHFATGAALGLLVALIFIFDPSRHVSDMIVYSAMPLTMMAVTLGVFTLTFAVGSTLTGVILILMEP